MDAGLDRTLLILLYEKGPLQHHEIYAFLRVKCTSSRTFYKSYHRLINQRLIERKLTPPERYYKYNITDQGRLILHPELQKELQESPQMAEKTQDSTQSPSIASSIKDTAPISTSQPGSPPIHMNSNPNRDEVTKDWQQAFIGLMNAIQALNQGIQSLSTRIPSQTTILHEMEGQALQESSRVSEDAIELDSVIDSTPTINSLKNPDKIPKNQDNFEDSSLDNTEIESISETQPVEQFEPKQPDLSSELPEKLLEQLRLAVQENNQALIQQLNQEFQRRKFTDDLWKDIVMLETLNVTNVGDLEQLKHFWVYLVKSPLSYRDYTGIAEIVRRIVEQFPKLDPASLLTQLPYHVLDYLKNPFAFQKEPQIRLAILRIVILHPEFIRKKQARQDVDIEIWSTTYKEYIELAAQQISFENLIQNLEEYLTSADIQKLIYQLNLKNFKNSTLENVFKALVVRFYQSGRLVKEFGSNWPNLFDLCLQFIYDKARYPHIVTWLEDNINQSDAMAFYEYFKENFDYIALIVFEFMLNLAKTKKLPGYSTEKIMEIFSAYTKSGEYFNPHLYQWYQYFDAQNLLTYDDFIQELEYLLNIGAYEILEKEIDQHGFRYATGIKTQTLDNFHHMLFNPAAMDSTEKTDVLKDIMLRSWIQQKRYDYIFTTFSQTTDTVIFPYLIRSAVYLKKSCSDWWLNPPPHRPGILLWSYTRAMMDFDIHDKRQIMNYLLKQRTAFVGFQQTAADWYLARLHTDPEIEKFAPVFARWLMNQGQKPREQAKLLLIEWQKNTQKRFEVLETNYQVLEILRYVDPENAVTYERLREELIMIQKDALQVLQQEKESE